MAGHYQVFNHTDRELIVATTEDGTIQYRLLPQCVSPPEAEPRLLWERYHQPIDDKLVWKLAVGFDVHVSETGFDSSIGAPAPARINATLPASDLHISGLGITDGGAVPAPTERGAWFYHRDEAWVTVLGAGITGLTAAHELVTRGFRVQVIDRAHGSPVDAMDSSTGVQRFRRGLDEPDVGGIARTQWSTQPLPPHASASLRTPSPGVTPDTPESLRSVHGDAVWFGSDREGAQAMGSYCAYALTWTDGKLDSFATKLNHWFYNIGAERSIAGVQLVVVVYGGEDPGRVRRAYSRLDDFLMCLSVVEPLTPSIPYDRIQPNNTLLPEGDDSAAMKTLWTTLSTLQVLPTARIDVAEVDPTTATQAESKSPSTTADSTVTPPSQAKRCVGLLVRVHEDLGLIAGEHGFRYFPGFYRHIRDTMQRTPIFDPVTKTFTPRTTLDNLREVDWQVIVDPMRPHAMAMSRSPFSTIGGLIDQYNAMRRDIGYRPIDLLRFSLRILRYMTSSIKRRKAYYEDMSWWTFLSKRHLDDPDDDSTITYGERFGEGLRHGPKAFVAMTSEYADARTQGSIALQLLMDQFGLHDQSDSTLIGPTSTNWLTHWRTYLEEQGVRFFVGEITEISTYPTGDKELPVRAKVTIEFPGPPPAEYLDGEAKLKEHAIHAHYLLSALDVVALARVTSQLRASGAAGVLADLSRLVRDAKAAATDRDLENIQITGVAPDDRFQVLTGIQLYYRSHVSFASGHIYFAASEWGLSAISQVQFWGPFGSGHRGKLSGNLSVDIGSWRATPGVNRAGHDPNDMTRNEIAAEVQSQIENLDVKRPRPALRRASFYHLDDFIGFALRPDSNSKFVPVRNYSPFLINVTGEWKLRPRGEPWTPNDLISRDRQPGTGVSDGPLWSPLPSTTQSQLGYPMHYGNLVVAGTHMRTFTRMGTMEAANESARHAVNTVLDYATSIWAKPQPTDWAPIPTARLGGQPNPNINVDRSTTPFGDYCDIWNPEYNEFQDLEFLRTIDSHLIDASLQTADDDVPPGTERPVAPHLFDILRIDELPDHLEDDRDAIGALETIGNILKAFDGAQTSDLSSVLAAVDRARKKLTELFERTTR